MNPVSPVLKLGYVARAHGLKGEVGVKPFDADSETLAQVKRVLVEREGKPAQTVNILSARPTPQGMLLVLEGITTREAAEALRGATVSAFREDLGALGEAEFFQGDLVGLTALDEAGAVLGKVEALWETGPVPNLVIKQEDGQELMIPFAEEFVPEVDVSGGRVVVRPLQLEE